jgi:unsaturated rhamnogalacturonyl hydrolase
MKMILSRIAFLFGFALFSVACVFGESTAAAPQTFSGATPLEWSVRLADSEMARRGDSLVWKPGGKAKWDYAAGLFTLSLLKLNDKIPTPRYVEFTEQAIGSFVASNRMKGYSSENFQIQTYNPKEYQLDALNSGRTLLALWQTVTNPDQPQLFYGCAKLMEQIESQPRTPDGGFWHKQRYTNQMWLDGIYMAEPFCAAMGRFMMNRNGTYDEVAKQIRLVDEHTYDAKTGLNYHGWDAAKIQPWANPQTGCSSNFWGRADGWYAMALVDVLDYFPTNHPARPQIIATFQKACAGIVKWQDPQTGLWWQVMDQGGRKGNYLEATASSMFVYALAKGVNRGYLPRADAAAAEKGYDGIVKNLIKDDGGGKWSLTQCCSVAGLGVASAAGRSRDGSFDYYVSEPVVKNDLKGVGPFILAGIELQQLANKQ